jgi:hypothetical protein
MPCFPAISASNLTSRPQEPDIALHKCSEKDLNLAEDVLREGAQLAAGLQYLDATGYFVLRREIVSAFKHVAIEAAELYTRASFYLGLVYGMCEALEIAEITITSAEELLPTKSILGSIRYHSSSVASLLRWVPSKSSRPCMMKRGFDCCNALRCSLVKIW